MCSGHGHGIGSILPGASGAKDVVPLHLQESLEASEIDGVEVRKMPVSEEQEAVRHRYRIEHRSWSLNHHFCLSLTVCPPRPSQGPSLHLRPHPARRRT
eukprot:scaffold1954_cov268-Pinguiococcus_pyrenoidosus.AAC.199